MLILGPITGIITAHSAHTTGLPSPVLQSGTSPASPSQTGDSKPDKPDVRHFSAVFNNQNMGDAVYTRTASDDSFEKKLDIHLLAKDGTVEIVEDYVYSNAGSPKSLTYEQIVNGHPYMTVTATFATDGTADVHFTLPEGSNSRNFAPPNGNATLDPTNLWFFKNKPKLGDKAEFDSFDAARGVWNHNSATYEKDEDVKVGDLSVSTHKLTFSSDTGNQTLFVDDRGIPVEIDQGQIIFRWTPESDKTKDKS